MDWDRIQGNWKQFVGRLKEQWGKLTDDDLAAINGRRDRLEGRFRSGTPTQRTRLARQSTSGFTR